MATFPLGPQRVHKSEMEPARGKAQDTANRIQIQYGEHAPTIAAARSVERSTPRSRRLAGLGSLCFELGHRRRTRSPSGAGPCRPPGSRGFVRQPGPPHGPQALIRTPPSPTSPLTDVTTSPPAYRSSLSTFLPLGRWRSTAGHAHGRGRWFLGLQASANHLAERQMEGLCERLFCQPSRNRRKGPFCGISMNGTPPARGRPP